MLSFVTFIAIFNFLLGFAIGSYVVASRGRVVRIVGDVESLSRVIPRRRETPPPPPPAGDDLTSTNKHDFESAAQIPAPPDAEGPFEDLDQHPLFAGNELEEPVAAN